MSESKIINDFVIKFANVNGSGSASANQMFAKGVFRMGIPVSPKNIFPSNIQGLPTWFEVRVNEKGYLGRRDGVDIAVIMNPQSYNQDIKELIPGGYLIYDSSWERNFDRTDINVIGIPIIKMCQEKFTNIKQRQLFKNIVYVGALAALLDIDIEVYKGLISEQFQGKEKLIEPNITALMLGHDHIKDSLISCNIKIEKRNKTDDMILISGNDASGLGCVYGGATICSWYPITPSTSLPEAFAKYSEQFRKDPISGKNNYAFIQSEDELAAIGMVIGANWNGARGFTATSGPGISLMSEFLGLAYFAEIPLVLFDVQRGGPSTGMPTRTQQSDILSCAYASHGDTKHVLLIPSNPKECFEFSATAFDLADQLQTPIIVLSDLDLGMNDWSTKQLEWNDSKNYNKGKVLSKEDLDELEDFGRYLDVDGDGIPYRTYPGTHPDKGAFFTRGTSHDEYARYTEDGKINAENLKRLVKKFSTASQFVPGPLFNQEENNSNLGVIYFGSTDVSMQEALDTLQDMDIQLDGMRIRAFPFNLEVWEFIEDHDLIFLVEQNRDGQMKTLIMAEGGISAEKLVSILCYDGQPITADLISSKIRDYLLSNSEQLAVSGK
ncbi:MAG: 2-oxoacid:acceptor oxidoreductase subunit alpha [SAR86 cluster bacterium]|nr:2-oxoacid:acceptor oxidoreductase subunit alpha [SAR86 cluster bacterium]